jgi:hypothetical protein
VTLMVPDIVLVRFILSMFNVNVWRQQPATHDLPHFGQADEDDKEVHILNSVKNWP